MWPLYILLSAKRQYSPQNTTIFTFILLCTTYTCVWGYFYPLFYSLTKTGFTGHDRFCNIAVFSKHIHIGLCALSAAYTLCRHAGAVTGNAAGLYGYYKYCQKPVGRIRPNALVVLYKESFWCWVNHFQTIVFDLEHSQTALNQIITTETENTVNSGKALLCHKTLT